MDINEKFNLDEYSELKKEFIDKQEVSQKISAKNNNLIAQLLSENNPIKIELGAGKERQIEGWTTIDISGDCDLILDLRNPLLFPDESVTEIYSSHVLEHFLYPYQMAGILNECFRVLKKGGIFSVCVPNARIYIEAYLNKEKFDPERYCQYKPAYHYNSPIDYINYIAYMAGNHLHLFDEENLVSVLSQAGFNNVRMRDFDSSIDLESRRDGSIYAIAEKASSISISVDKQEMFISPKTIEISNREQEIGTMDNSELLASSKLIRVDLGCGTHKEEGFIGVDVIAGDQVDVIADLNGDFPFPDNSIDFIKAHDFIEHLPDRIHTMNEIWRICKPDAIIDISVPSTDGRGAFQDPTHVSFWNLNSFMYYCQEFPLYLAGCQSHYGFKGEFSIVSIEEKQSAHQVIHVHAVLKAIKSEENSYQLNLKNINLIIFPDWNQSMNIIFEQMVNVCQAIIDHPKNSDIALLVNTQNTNLEDAQFLLADVLMNLCYDKNTEINDDNSPEFNLLNINSTDEYKGLLPVLSSRIVLEDENKEFINQIGLEQLPYCTLEELKNASLAILDKLPYLPLQKKESSLSKAYQKFAEHKFVEAVELFRQAIIENPQFANTGLIPLAHSLILTLDWQEISRNLPTGINYLETSGWLNSLYLGKPVNQEAKPIPWYTYPAIEFIENKINTNFRVFEYGSGNSSLWWSERVTQVISMESDANWFEYIKKNMPSNVELYLIEDDLEYASAINQYEDHYFDVIIVDGINRNQCAEFALSKVKDQGFLIFDNTDDHRYAEGVKKLLESGFIRIDFYGMIPSYLYKNCTSIFFKDIKLLSRGGLPSEKRSCLGRSCFQITSPVIAI